MIEDSTHLPGSLVFLRPGCVTRGIFSETFTQITWRMTTHPCLVVGSTNRLTDADETVSLMHVVFIPHEGLAYVAGSSLMTDEEANDSTFFLPAYRYQDL